MEEMILSITAATPWMSQASAANSTYAMSGAAGMNETTFGNPISVAKATTWMGEKACMSSNNVMGGAACMQETAIINVIKFMNGAA